MEVVESTDRVEFFSFDLSFGREDRRLVGEFARIGRFGSRVGRESSL